jgi:GAF domain-containing protein/HAMP domain-containing protein
MGWKMALIMLIMSLGAIGTALAGMQGLGVMRYHASNLYNSKLAPIISINRADLTLADTQLHLNALGQPGLTPPDRIVHISWIQGSEIIVNDIMTHYETEWVTTADTAFTAILRDQGQLALQKDEVGTLAAYHTWYDQYVQAQKAYLASIEAGTPDDQLANQAIQALTLMRTSLEHLIIVNNDFAKISNGAAVSAYRQTLRNMGLVLALALLLGLAASFVVARSITLRLGNLTEAASSLRQGQWGQLVTVVGRDEIAQLSEAFITMSAQLRDLIGSLEQRVTERTAALEVRSRYLQASAEVGRAASSILESDQLIRQAVELIRERFELYYVGLFLADEPGEWAVLRAGTGEAGQKMLARGHKLRIGGDSMIGWSIANAQPRIAQVAAQDAVRLATAELPDTRSEAALPLRSRGRVLGALSVQSDKPGVFDEAALAVLQIMADQVALAISNAQLFQQAQASLEAERRAYGELSQQAWKQLLGRRGDLGFVRDQTGLVPAMDELAPQMQEAMLKNQIAVSQDGGATLAVPIQVRGQVVGVVDVERPNDASKWTPEEIALIETLTEQLGMALEGARLYQDTQRRAARERVLREVTARVRSSTDPETVLKSLLREVGTVLGRQTFVRLVTPEEDLVPQAAGGNGNQPGGREQPGGRQQPTGEGGK